MIKTSFYCLALALLLRFAFDQATAQQVVTGRETSTSTHAFFMPNRIGLEWHFLDEYRIWLEIDNFNKAEWPKEGWNPSFCYLISKYKPLVKPVGDRWQITFTSEIAEKGAGIP